MLNIELIFVKAAQRVRAQAYGMDAIQRLVFSLLLSLALALAGTAQGLPQMSGPAFAEMVICADGGVKTVQVALGDAPATAPDDCATCPDCLSLAGMDLSGPNPAPAAFEVAAEPVVPVRIEPLFPASPHLRPETRGPPPVAHGHADPECADVPPVAVARATHGVLHLNGRCQTEARR